MTFDIFPSDPLAGFGKRIKKGKGREGDGLSGVEMDLGEAG